MLFAVSILCYIKDQKNHFKRSNMLYDKNKAISPKDNSDIFINDPFIRCFCQVFTNKEVGKKNADLIDSLKKSEYPYSLPILGAKATKAGYNLPYSAGVSINYFWQVSDLIIDNLKVGFNNGPMYNLDEIVRFDKARTTASATTIRPDIWLFPFLNIYGILGTAKASTEVGFGVWVPDSTNTPKQITSATSLVEFNTTTYGIGFTPTIGVGGGFLALDMNVAWTDVPQLSKPARSFIFGPRLGKISSLKNLNKQLQYGRVHSGCISVREPMAR
jgi:hypothetical protein